MQWTDEGIVLGTRRHGETSLIVELMTRDHGRHLGLVRGGRSKRLQPVLQPGNSVAATWRARLDEHLGYFAVELTMSRAAALIQSAASLHALRALAALLRLLPERDPHPRLYEHLAVVLGSLDDAALAAGLVAVFEVRLLEDLGFGLDLDQCAVTGSNDDLAFVSPKTGRAVTRSAGEPYQSRLLPLPAFLLAREGRDAPSGDDIAAAFHLTGYFLARHVFEPRGLPMPEPRAMFLSEIGRAMASAAEAAE